MKKILMVILVLVMALCATACGGSEKDAASQASSENMTAADTSETDTTKEDTTATDTTNEDTAQTDTATADAIADDQAMAESDYNQLLTYVQGLSDHSAMVDQLRANREQYDAGNLTADDLVNGYQQVSDDSQQLLGSFQSATWGSESYNDQIALLGDTLSALAQTEALSMEAVTSNDESKLTEADTYRKTYEDKMDEFLTAMGV